MACISLGIQPNDVLGGVGWLTGFTWERLYGYNFMDHSLCVALPSKYRKLNSISCVIKGLLTFKGAVQEYFLYANLFFNSFHSFPRLLSRTFSNLTTVCASFKSMFGKKVHTSSNAQSLGHSPFSISSTLPHESQSSGLGLWNMTFCLFSLYVSPLSPRKSRFLPQPPLLALHHPPQKRLKFFSISGDLLLLNSSLLFPFLFSSFPDSPPLLFSPFLLLFGHFQHLHFRAQLFSQSILYSVLLPQTCRHHSPLLPCEESEINMQEKISR